MPASVVTQASLWRAQGWVRLCEPDEVSTRASSQPFPSHSERKNLGKTSPSHEEGLIALAWLVQTETVAGRRGAEVDFGTSGTCGRRNGHEAWMGVPDGEGSLQSRHGRKWWRESRSDMGHSQCSRPAKWGTAFPVQVRGLWVPCSLRVGTGHANCPGQPVVPASLLVREGPRLPLPSRLLGSSAPVASRQKLALQ